MITNCDMCASKIDNNECQCGKWFSKEEVEKFIYERKGRTFYEGKN